MQSVCHDNEAPSTSCAEEAPLVLEAPSRAGLVRKVVALASGAVLVAVAGASWTRGGGVFGDSVTGLQVDFPPPFATYRTLGCSNWESIAYTKDIVESEQVCRDKCMADENCTSYNWQAKACQEGWAVDNGCMIFRGPCETMANPCWGLNYKLIYDVM